MKRGIMAASCILFLLLACLWFSISLKAYPKVLLQCKREYEVIRRGAIDVISKKEVWITVPKFARIKHFRFLQVSKETYKVEVETHAPIPIKTKDKVLFILFSYAPFIGITCGIGSSLYRSPAPSRFGDLEGGIYSLHSGQSKWIAPLTSATIKENKLTFEFPSKFVQYPEEFYRVAKFAVHYSPFKFKLKFTTLVDGVDFEFPNEREIIYMTCMGFPPPP